MRHQQERGNRAVAPVVGIALLVGVTVILAAIVGSVVFDTGIGPSESPDTTLSFQVVDDSVELSHEGGESLDESQIVVRDTTGTSYNLTNPGVVVGDADTIHSGEVRKIAVDPDTVEKITVVWQDSDSSTETVLATFKP